MFVIDKPETLEYNYYQGPVVLSGLVVVFLVIFIVGFFAIMFAAHFFCDPVRETHYSKHKLFIVFLVGDLLILLIIIFLQACLEVESMNISIILIFSLIYIAFFFFIRIKYFNEDFWEKMFPKIVAKQKGPTIDQIMSGDIFQNE